MHTCVLRPRRSPDTQHHAFLVGGHLEIAFIGGAGRDEPRHRAEERPSLLAVQRSGGTGYYRHVFSGHPGVDTPWASSPWPAAPLCGVPAILAARAGQAVKLASFTVCSPFFTNYSHLRHLVLVSVSRNKEDGRELSNRLDRDGRCAGRRFAAAQTSASIPASGSEGAAHRGPGGNGHGDQVAGRLLDLTPSAVLLDIDGARRDVPLTDVLNR